MCLPSSPGNLWIFFKAVSHLFRSPELTQVFHFSYTQRTSSRSLSTQMPSFAEVKVRGMPFAYPSPLSSYLFIHLTAFYLYLSCTLSHLLAQITIPRPSSKIFWTTIISCFIKASIASITKIAIWEYFKLLSTSSLTNFSSFDFAWLANRIPAVSTS